MFMNNLRNERLLKQEDLFADPGLCRGSCTDPAIRGPGIRRSRAGSGAAAAYSLGGTERRGLNSDPDPGGSALTAQATEAGYTR